MQIMIDIDEDAYNTLKSYTGNLTYSEYLIKNGTPQPKTGHWIKYGIPRCEEQHYQCTHCNYYINFGKWGELYTKEFKYCPNCGAKMESEE